MNGKDTHVRGLKVLGPLGSVFVHFRGTSLTRDNCRRRRTYEDSDPFPFLTPKFRMYERIR